MEHALIYCRVSTEEQAEDGHHSLNTQLKLCKRAIEESNKFKLAEDGVFEDPGRSATNMNRPGLQDMLLQVQEDKTIKAIFIQDTDRLARNANDHLTIKALLKKHGVELISVSQPGITDSPEGNFMDLVIAGVNQLQSQITSRKTLKSLEQKFKDGWWPGFAPVGYLNAGDPSDEKKRIVITDEGRAPFVQEAFKMYATGDYSVLEVRDAFYKKGLVSARGARIAHSKMIEMFKNPFYTGEMRWRKMINKGNHPPLIDKDLYERVQIVMAEHNRYACRRRKFNFILRGFMFCFICRQRYTAEHHFKKNKSYYHCNRAGDQIKCSDKYVEVWDLEEQVANLFQQIQFSQSFIDKVITRVEKMYKGRKDEINKEKRQFIAQKLAVEQKRDIAEEKLFSGLITDEDFARNKKKFREQIEALNDEIYKLDKKLDIKLEEAQEVLALVRNIYKTYVNAPDELKRLYLGLFWERFEAAEKVIKKAEPTDLIKAMIKERSIILADNTLPQTRNPEPVMAGARAPQREVIISNFWGDQRESNPRSRFHRAELYH